MLRDTWGYEKPKIETTMGTPVPLEASPIVSAARRYEEILNEAGTLQRERNRIAATLEKVYATIKERREELLKAIEQATEEL